MKTFFNDSVSAAAYLLPKVVRAYLWAIRRRELPYLGRFITLVVVHKSLLGASISFLGIVKYISLMLL